MIADASAGCVVLTCVVRASTCVVLMADYLRGGHGHTCEVCRVPSWRSGTCVVSACVITIRVIPLATCRAERACEPLTRVFIISLYVFRSNLYVSMHGFSIYILILCMSFRFGLARCMLLKPSPFSPMDKRESSEEEEVSGDRPDAAEEEPDPEGKKERKARLVPKKGSQERGRADRRRSRSRRSRSRWPVGTAQTGKRRRRKKRSIRDGLRQVGRGADRRLRRVLLGPPPPKPGEKTPQKKREHADSGKGGGKNLKGGPKKQMCKICGSRVAGTPSALDQHQWLSEYCLAWQAYERMTPYQKEQTGAWEKAKKIGQGREEQSCAPGCHVCGTSRTADDPQCAGEGRECRVVPSRASAVTSA